MTGTPAAWKPARLSLNWQASLVHTVSSSPLTGWLPGLSRDPRTPLPDRLQGALLLTRLYGPAPSARDEDNLGRLVDLLRGPGAPQRWGMDVLDLLRDTVRGVHGDIHRMVDDGDVRELIGQVDQLSAADQHALVQRYRWAAARRASEVRQTVDARGV